MTLVSGRDILLEAARKGYAIGGFDVFNLETIQAVINAAEEVDVPVFIQMCITSVQYANLGYGVALLKEASKVTSVPVCLHLDHGPETSNINELKECMLAGFNSIMVDGSSLTIEENISLSKKIVEFARPRRICVEGELGRVSRNINATKEEIQQLMTDPEEAAKYVERSGIDYLAVSVGSVSGFVKESNLTLDFERLEKIRKKVNVPLVFHGGTGIPESQLKQAIQLGVSKINIAHGLRKAFLDSIKNYLNTNQNEIDPRKVLKDAIKSAEEFAKKKIKQLCML